MSLVKALNGNLHDCRAHNLVTISRIPSNNKVFAVSAEIFHGDLPSEVFFRDDFTSKEAAEAKIAELKAGAATLVGKLEIYCLQCENTCLRAYRESQEVNRNG